MTSDLFQTDDTLSNLYLKINEQKLGPVTRQEVLQLLNQQIVVKKDMVSNGLTGPWVEIGHSNFELELALATFDVKPTQIANTPITPKKTTVVPVGQTVTKPITPRPFNTKKSSDQAPSKGGWSLLVGLAVIVGCGGMGWLWISGGGPSFGSFPNKNYAKEWKKNPFPLPKSVNDPRSIDVWDKNNIFIFDSNEIHYWNGKEWRLLHKTGGYGIDLSRVKAIGPDRVIAVSERNSKPFWVISDPRGTKTIDFDCDSLSSSAIRGGRPILGKNGEYIFTGGNANYLYKDGKTKRINADEFFDCFYKDPKFAKFLLEATMTASTDGYRILFEDYPLGIAGFSKGTEILIVEQKDGKKTSYQMVGEDPEAWMAWARSPTDFWVMANNGTLRRTDGGLLKIISKPALNYNGFSGFVLDRKTGTLYGVSRDAVWTLDE